ncbi:HAD-IIB family hydrolase [Saccharibacillus sp. JS10]|uniref:HAD-IIB family hydrolase n=1 Tax=Saccharibacillus sp. JS10 TaxID=2950552 RepID=UPI00210C76A9|nr:HAD-IIB family hydrolase [Saccharibacillus sp. JS10]MCQ4085429.1 HAD family hydrolase [Saccharibacillus sp. JS10]
MFKLIVSDLDGTFLNATGGFNRQRFANVYAQMKQQAIEFAACTGKQCERVEELFAGFEGIWILGDSATRIKRDGKVIQEFTLERELALQSIQEIEEFDQEMIVIACTGDAAYVYDTLNEEDYRLVKSSYREVIKVSSFDQVPGAFVKVTVFDAKGRTAELRRKIEHTLGGKIYMVDSEPRWLDIAALGTHKGETVTKLQHRLGITREETIAFGDGENDIELMQIAEFSFAVRNACENTKEAAAFVTRSNDEDGVLMTIEKLLKLQPSLHV